MSWIKPGICAVMLFAANLGLPSAATGASAPQAGVVGPHRPVKPATAAPVSPPAPCVAKVTDPTTSGGVTYFRDCADTPDMVTFGGGQFRMGDLFGNGLEYERPVHDVHVNSFALGRNEVTIAEWQQCMQANACSAPAPYNAPKPKNHPVVGVTWDQTQEYVAWLSRHTGKRYRLPSEAEWEYAARAGSPDEYTWGNWAEMVCEHANSLDASGYREHPQMSWYIGCDDGFGDTAPVGSYPPNAWGLYDMLGNVWEWVQDCWHSDYTGAPTDGSAWLVDGDCSKRINRGGGWGNNPRALRVSNRDADPQGTRSDGMGFRVARNVADVAKRRIDLPSTGQAAGQAAGQAMGQATGVEGNVRGGQAPR